MDCKNNEKVQSKKKLGKWKKILDTYYSNISKKNLKKDLEEAGFVIKDIQKNNI